MLLVVRRGGDDGLVAVVNLAPSPARLAALKLDGRELLLSTEDARYGGPRGETSAVDEILPHELLIFGASGGQP